MPAVCLPPEFQKVLFPETEYVLDGVYVQGIRNPATGGQHVPYNLNGDSNLPNVEEIYRTYADRVSDAEFYLQTRRQADKFIVAPYEDLFGKLDGEIEDKVSVIQEKFFGGAEI